jgi:metal-sulfur cluster biosynthetic enzyme
MVDSNRTQDVWSALGTVTDPEIDESVTSLEFVTSVRIESGNKVHIEFRLPTYWCAPNFAFLMASDMRDAVAELPWVENVTVRLLDHFSAELIGNLDHADQLAGTHVFTAWKRGRRPAESLPLYLEENPS